MIVSVLISLGFGVGILFVHPAHAELTPVVKIHGELEYEYSCGNGTDVETQFQIDKFVIHPKINFGDYLELCAQWYCRPKGESYLNEVCAKFCNLPFDNWLDIGIYERAIKDHHSRKTETYSLYGNIFYRDDTYGISLGNWQRNYQAPPFYWIFSLTEGFNVGHIQPGEQIAKYCGTNEDKILQDARDDKNNLYYPEIGMNLGLNRKLLGRIQVDVMGFYYTDKLNDSERSELENYLSDDQKNSLNQTNNERNRVGIQVNTKLGGSRLFAGFLSANDAGLARRAYVVELLYNIKFRRLAPFLKSTSAVVSYSNYSIDGKSYFFDRLESWDREQIILAWILEILEKKLNYM